MKNLTKKLFSVLLALTLVLSMGTVAFAAEGDDDTTDSSTYTLTITGTTTGHTYDVYQIFSGVLSTDDDGNKVLSDIKWGEGVNDTAFLTALKADNTLGSLFTNCTTAADVAEVMGGDDWTAANTQAFAELLASTTTTGEGESATTSYTYLSTATKSSVSSTATSTVISGLAAGYYIVVETTSSVPETETVTDYIVQVVGDTTVAVKAGTVTSDKQVQDEVADAETGATDGWGETADHAIGESFQFKLIANISADVNVTGYDTYMLIFNDTVSKGITYESIASVTISDGTNSYTLTSDQYTLA